MATELAVTDDNGDVDDRIEKLIWRGLGRKSARQIAEEAGVSPEVVLRVKRDLLESVDVLTTQEKKTKLVVDLQDIAQRVQDDYDKAPFEFKAGLMNSGIAAMKAVLTELNRTAKGEQEAVERLNSLRVRELLDLVNATVVAGVAEIAETHGLDEGDLLAVFNRHLNEEAQKRDNL